MSALGYLRVPVAFGLALIIAAATFWFLARLIASPTDMSEMAKATRIEFTRMRKDTEVEKKREEVRKAERERTAQVPVTPRMSVSTNTSLTSAPVQMVQPKIDASGVRMNLSGGGSDRGATLLVKTPGDYPQRALSRGAEGWVIVRMTITASGAVKDPEVVDSEPKDLFDQAAIKTVLRWRYNPRVENGVPVQQSGLLGKVVFKLEN